ncbi:M1 family metallopeptidase [Galbibacter mesophilus]|uniref:M1 family metallopeptidase n=1 Tax=Galbibacter mesophilus TaxID=379069 RepID=UPI00191F2EBF|nr:M1 family metallopeptidase [Galbibacter mesophilus]MCM5664094.1 M1 family metallopeptidase [Galbibacter mesophilus]
MKLISFLSFFIFFAAGFAQQTTFIDVKKGEVSISVAPSKKQISGSVLYTFDVLKETDSMAVDAKSMEVESVMLDNEKVNFSYNDQRILIQKEFKSNGKHQLQIIYNASPKKALYFTTLPNGNTQVWTQGQGKYTSNWLPSYDEMSEKIEFDLTITAPSQYEVIANGELKSKNNINTQTVWEFDMKQPMSSYLVAFAVGKYAVKEEKSATGIDLKMYYYPQNENLVEPTYRHSKRIFDFLEDEIGMPYPWQEYKQVPVKDFLYAGMENTSLTIFSDTYFVDSTGFTDKNYINVNAHELAHQWFGNLVTEESSTHHWLHEGFATYFALLAERNIFGDAYFYEQLHKTAKQLSALNEQGGESLLDPKASSLTFYQRGAWAIFALHELIGDRAFDKTVKKFLKDYAYKNANTNDFFSIAEAKSMIQLDNFVEKWMVSEEFPIEEAHLLLNQNALTKILLDLDKMTPDEVISFAGVNEDFFRKKEKSPIANAILQRITVSSEKELAIFSKALSSEVLKTRQAAAIHLNNIPESLKKSFEGLLVDKSYLTIENALFKLWSAFPADRTSYLNKTKGIEGFQDKNIETLWLTLALITEGYEEASKMDYYQTLVSYTEPKQHFEVRQHAFQYLYQIQALNEIALKNLIEACQHPVWQFSKFSRGLLDELLKNEDYTMMLKGIANQLDAKNKAYLSSKLNQ